MASPKTRSQSRSELRRRRKRGTQISLIALVVVVLSFPLWSRPLARFAAGRMVAWSSHYRIKETVIVGNRALSLEQISELAKVPSGSSLLHTPVRHIRARLEQHPWIKHAYVRRRLPDTIEIRITEREPVAAVRGGGLLMLTSDSMIVAPLTQNWQWDLPILTPPRALKLKEGFAVTDSSTLAMLHEMLVLRKVSPEAWKNLSEMYYAGGEIHATLSQPPIELLLGHGVTELAWAGALKLMQDAKAVDPALCQSLDLRFPGRIIVSMNTPTAEERISG